MERLADSVDEVYNFASGTLSLANIWLMLYLLFKTFILFYILIFVKAIYQWTVVCVPVVVRIPQFEKPWRR